MTNTGKVVTNPKYILLAAIVAIGVIVFAVWLPNLQLVTQTITSSTLTVAEKMKLLTSLLGALQTNFTTFSRVLMLLSAFLIGIQTALLAFYIRQKAQVQQTIGVSFIGTVASLLGVGCASCGSVLLTTVFGLSSMGFILAVLPLKGQEFSILGIGILLLVIWKTANKINHPELCKIERK